LDIFQDSLPQPEEHVHSLDAGWDVEKKSEW